MIIDKFVMQWQADTKQAATAIDELGKKADDVANKSYDAAEKVSDGIKKVSAESLKDAREASNEIKDAAKELEKARRGTSEAGKKAQQGPIPPAPGNRFIGPTPTPVPPVPPPYTGPIPPAPVPPEPINRFMGPIPPITVSPIPPAPVPPVPPQPQTAAAKQQAMVNQLLMAIKVAADKLNSSATHLETAAKNLDKGADDQRRDRGRNGGQGGPTPPGGRPPAPPGGGPRPNPPPPPPPGGGPTPPGGEPPPAPTGFGGVVSGGMMAFTAALAAGIIVVKTFAAVMEVATKQGEKALLAREQAWEMGTNVAERNKAVLRGRAMGLSDEEVVSSQSSLFARAMAAANNPYSIEALRFRQGGISTRDKGGMRTMEDINAQIFSKMNSGKFKTEAEKTAWAVHHLGMSFQEASRLAQTDVATMEKYNRTAKEQAAILNVGQVVSEKLALSQRSLSDANDLLSVQFSTALSPALTRFTDKMTEMAGESDTLVGMLGKFFGSILDGIVSIIEYAEKLGNAIGSALYDISSAIGQWLDQVRQTIANSPLSFLLGDSGAARPTSGPIVPEKEPEEKSARDAYIDDTLKKMIDKAQNKEGLSDTQKSEVIAALKLIAENTRKGTTNLSDMLPMMSDVSDKLSVTNDVAKQQAEYSRPPIPVMPVQIGLEQALSLWASGLGKAAQLKGPEGAAAANTRADYEKVAKIQMQLQMSPAYNPNAVVPHTSDMMKNLDSVMSKYHSMGVTINQNNSYNIDAKGGTVGNREVSKISLAQDASNKSLVNSVSDNMAM